VTARKATPKRGPGRPTSDSTRTQVVAFRVSDEERARLDVGAARARRSLADWARLTLLDAAHEGDAP